MTTETVFASRAAYVFHTMTEGGSEAWVRESSETLMEVRKMLTDSVHDDAWILVDLIDEEFMLRTADF